MLKKVYKKKNVKKHKKYFYCSICNIAWVWKTSQRCDGVRINTALLLLLEMALPPNHSALTKLILLKTCICRRWVKVNDFRSQSHLTFLIALGKFHSVLYNKSLLSITAEAAGALPTVPWHSLFSHKVTLCLRVSWDVGVCWMRAGLARAPRNQCPLE